MSQHYERASLLFSRQRYAEALPELQNAIAEDDDDSYAHGLMAICLSELDRHQQALAAAKRAVEVAPDSDYGHYVLARVYLDRSHLNEAFAAISTAVQLDPEDDLNHAWLARVEFERGNWEAAVAAADEGLALDAENDMCLHYRSLALTKLGRGDEARQDQETLLAADPNDPHSHAARGWTLLEEGEPEQAKEHFLEALRLDPSVDYARVGLANALKAKYLVFGLALRCLLYLGRFKGWMMWIIWIGAFLGLNKLDRLATAHPDWLMPLVFLKAVVWSFAVLLLVAHPLFDLILRLDRDGRRALSPDQTKASNWHAVCLTAGLGMALLWAWKGDRQMLTLSLATLLLTIPITETFDASPGWVRIRMKWVTMAAAMLIPFSFVMFVAALFFLVKFKWHTVWMIKPALFYLPMTSVLISMFADSLAGYLEKRRPDAGPEPNRFT